MRARVADSGQPRSGAPQVDDDDRPHPWLAARWQAEGYRFTPVPDAVLDDGRLNSADLAVMFALLGRNRRLAPVRHYPADDLAAAVGFTPRTLRRALRRLEAAGHVTARTDRAGGLTVGFPCLKLLGVGKGGRR